MFTPKVFEILLFEVGSVLVTAQQDAGSERVKMLYNTLKIFWLKPALQRALQNSWLFLNLFSGHKKISKITETQPPQVYTKILVFRFRKIHKKTPVSELLFHNVADLPEIP